MWSTAWFVWIVFGFGFVFSIVKVPFVFCEDNCILVVTAKEINKKKQSKTKKKKVMYTEDLS